MSGIIWTDEPLGVMSWSSQHQCYMLRIDRRDDLPLSFNVHTKLGRDAAIGECTVTDTHFHITCRYCGWRTLRIYMPGSKPDLECRAEFLEHAVTHKEHPVRAWTAELALRLWAYLELHD